MKFKTNINCSGCIAKVTPFLNTTEGIEKWEVDTNIPEKILTVEARNLTHEQIIAAVQRAGFKIEALA
jgi:copper chaperone